MGLWTKPITKHGTICLSELPGAAQLIEKIITSRERLKSGDKPTMIIRESAVIDQTPQQEQLLPWPLVCLWNCPNHPNHLS